MRFVFVILVGAALCGCGEREREAMVVASEKGVTVDAPGVHIDTDPGGAEVETPGTEVER